MKTKCNFIFFLILILVIGCASPQERTAKTIRSIEGNPPSQPVPSDVEGLVIPQKEEAKSPGKLFSFFARDASIRMCSGFLRKATSTS
jgi:hypothetical protein